MRHVATLLFVLFAVAATAKVEVTDLQVEHLTNPLGLDTDCPRFSWRLVSDGADVQQTAYEITVESDGRVVWNSGRVESGEQRWIPYSGEALKSGQYCTWHLRVTASARCSSSVRNGGETAEASGYFSIGLLGETYWGGRWIGMNDNGIQTARRDVRTDNGMWSAVHPQAPACYLRKEFSTQKPVRRALAYVCGLGLYEFFVNGIRQGTHVLQPVPSDYRKSVYYNTYDITSCLAGQNCIGIVLGNGRYFAPRQDKPYKNTMFGLPTCRMNIVIEYTDGSRERVVTDETWKVTADGPIRSNNEYDGETYDARRELTGWTSYGYDDRDWQQAERTALPQGTLRGQMTEGMVALPDASLGVPSPRVVKRFGRRRCIIDFCQNQSGWVAFTPRGKAGDTIRIRYAERLNADSTLYTDNLRDARSEDLYICGNKPQASNLKSQTPWHPTFVTHGFRYVEVTGMDDAQADEFQAYLVCDEMRTAGPHFEFSDTIINKVLTNAWWGIASNYKGMPVDCPQRNERQPWLGDRTIGALGESYLFDNERLYTKWTRDICEAQREDGCIPDVAPAFWNYYTDDVTWPAALPFVCDMLWQRFGNDEPLRRCYPNIRRWMLHILDRYVNDGIVTKDKYGDWCPPPECPASSGSLIATAYTIGCMQLLEQFASHQGLHDDVLWWQQRQEVMKDDFNRHFLTCRPGSSPRPGHPLYPDSIFYGSNTVTENLLALAFGIAPDSIRSEIAKQVVEHIVVQNKLHLSTGVIGTSWLLRTLTATGYGDVAYALATQKTYPSWGYMTEQDATTVWELWNGDTGDPKMNSGNHVMLLGDFIPWVYEHAQQCVPDTTCFTYQQAPFASPHAATIVETRTGNLVIAYFAGTYERNPDCNIYVQISERSRSGSHFSNPILAADGGGIACWNPVLKEMPDGELWLFYKVGVDVRSWTGWLVKSRDGGYTWSAPEPLPDGFLGPVKNKPLLLSDPSGDRLLCGSSTENDGWRFHVEILDLQTKKWRYIPIPSMLAPPTLQPDTLQPIDCIQPSFLQLKDGRLQVLMRSRNGKLATSYSGDQGETWTPVTLTSLPNNQSGTDAVTLRDGRHVLVYNDFETIPGTRKGPRIPLSVAISSDDGQTWQHLATLESSPVGEYSYPAVIEGKDGALHIVYTWRRQHIAYKRIILPPYTP